MTCPQTFDHALFTGLGILATAVGGIVGALAVLFGSGRVRRLRLGDRDEPEGD